jgi:hypothetical protein
MGTREEEGLIKGADTTQRPKQDSTRQPTHSNNIVFSRLGYK